MGSTEMTTEAVRGMSIGTEHIQTVRTEEIETGGMIEEVIKCMMQRRMSEGVGTEEIVVKTPMTTGVMIVGMYVGMTAGAMIVGMHVGMIVGMIAATFARMIVVEEMTETNVGIGRDQVMEVVVAGMKIMRGGIGGEVLGKTRGEVLRRKGVIGRRYVRRVIKTVIDFFELCSPA